MLGGTTTVRTQWVTPDCIDPTAKCPMLSVWGEVIVLGLHKIRASIHPDILILLGCVLGLLPYSVQALSCLENSSRPLGECRQDHLTCCVIAVNKRGVRRWHWWGSCNAWGDCRAWFLHLSWVFQRSGAGRVQTPLSWLWCDCSCQWWAGLGRVINIDLAVVRTASRILPFLLGMHSAQANKLIYTILAYHCTHMYTSIMAGDCITYS